MNRRWYKWFGLCAGLIVCVEACMLMVSAPDGNDVPLRDRISAWFDHVWSRPSATRGLVLVVDPSDSMVIPDEAVAQQGIVEVGGIKPLVDGAVQGVPAKATDDWPMFGGTLQRNMANPSAKNIPDDWSIEEGKVKNIKWSAQLGSKSYGGPVVADGKVFFGTNNSQPRDKTVKGLRAILMCFGEADGKFLWQAVHDIPPDPTFKDSSVYGLLSAPCVEGKRHYYVTPACVVICADNGTGKTLWSYDLMEKEKVVPYHCGNCSPLVVDDLVMVVTSNGSDDQNKIPSPKAPSFIAIDKNTGKPAWRSNLPGTKIIEGQWSNPAVAVVGGKKQVIFPGGDGVLYGFEAGTGKLVWSCNCNPLRDAKDLEYTPYIVATPVVHGDRCYVGLGVAPDSNLESSTRFGYLLCVDVTKSGEVSPRSFKAKDPANKDSALVWAYGGFIDPLPKKGRKNYFGRTLSTCAVHDGLLYASEVPGYLHCLDAQTGQQYWEDDLKAPIWGSPYYADGKVYLAREDGDVTVYQHGKKLKKLNQIEMGEGMHSTPVVANGVLYVSTWSKLFAIAEKK